MTFQFYTSDAASRYKDGALETLVYPRGHVVTFRYRALHVAKTVRDFKVKSDGEVKLPWFRRSAIVIYAETIGADSSTNVSSEEIDFAAIRERLLLASDPTSTVLCSKLSNEEQTLLRSHQSGPCSKEVQDIILGAINRVINGPCAYEEVPFKGLPLRPETTYLMRQYPEGVGLAHLNRLLLEDIYPRELCKNQLFNFYPLRHARLRKMWKRSSVFYALLELRDYVDYAQGQRLQFQNSIQLSDSEPPTKRIDTAGHGGNFLGISAKPLVPLIRQKNQIAEDNAWQTVTDVLSHSPILNKVLFCRARGFYRQGSFFGKNRQKLIRPSVSNTESFYRFSMARNYILKILINAPHVDQKDRSRQPILEISSQSKDSVVITPETIRISSSYNEDCILIACKRILDSTLVPLDLKKQKGESEGEMPELSFLTHVEVPRYLLVAFIVLAGLGAVFLSIGPDFVTGLFDLMALSVKPLDAAQLSVISKGMGAFFVVVSGYLAFRKLPTGK